MLSLRTNRIFSPSFNNDDGETRVVQKKNEFKNLLSELLNKFAYSMWLDFINVSRRYRNPNTIAQNPDGSFLYDDTPEDARFENAQGTQSELDWWQPWIGVKNIVGGIVGLIATPFMLINDLYYDVKRSHSIAQGIWNIGASILLTIPRLLTSTAHIVKGVTQLGTFLLTWGIKKPLRNLWTKIHKERTKNIKIEDARSVVNKLEEGKRNLREIEIAPDSAVHYDHLHTTMKNLHAIFQDRATKRRPTTLAIDQELACALAHDHCYEEISIVDLAAARRQKVETAKALCRLFKPDEPAFAPAGNGASPFAGSGHRLGGNVGQ